MPHIVRHIFRMARSTNFKLGTEIEDDDPHQTPSFLAQCCTCVIRGRRGIPCRPNPVATLLVWLDKKINRTCRYQLIILLYRISKRSCCRCIHEANGWWVNGAVYLGCTRYRDAARVSFHFYHLHGDKTTNVVLFSVVSVCWHVCVCVSLCLFVSAITLEAFEMLLWNFMGERYGQKLGWVWKWLHSDALSGQLSLLPSAGREMSNSYGCGVKA